MSTTGDRFYGGLRIVCLVILMGTVWDRVADGNGPGKASDSPILMELPWRNLAKTSHRDTSMLHFPHYPCIRPRRHMLVPDGLIIRQWPTAT